MVDDLIFHVTQIQQWEEHKKYGEYIPESLDTEGFIHCSKGNQVANVANRKFAGQQDLLLLVIDRATVKSNIKYEIDDETGEKYPHIYGPLNMDAVIDKIELQPDSEGQFGIEITEN